MTRHPTTGAALRSCLPWLVAGSLSAASALTVRGSGVGCSPSEEWSTRGVAHAQVTCPTPPDTTPGVQAVWPAAGVLDAPRNSWIRIEYGEALDELVSDPAPITVTHVSSDEALGGRLERQGQSLFFVPERQLDPLSEYAVSAVDVGTRFNYLFTTSGRNDNGNPQLTGELAVVSQEVHCPDARFRLDVTFPAASDDGPTTSLEYLVFLTRASGLKAPELRARARGFAADQVTLVMNLQAHEARDAVCVAVRVIDGRGRLAPQALSACIDPITERYFENACAVGRGGSTLPWWLMAIAYPWARRRTPHSRILRSKVA